MDLLGHLLNQYRHRYYNKIHKTGRILNNLICLNEKIKDKFEYKTFLIPPLCMPEDCKRDCYIFSYRKYYKEYKAYFAKYASVDTPEFMC